MSLRRILTACALAALAGCGVGRNFTGQVDFGQWTPEFACAALHEGGDIFDLVSRGGVVDDDAFWVIDAQFRFTVASQGGARPVAMNVGFFQHTYEGSADVGASLAFAGKDLSGQTDTSADVKLYKFTYEELQGQQSSVTGGLVGLHYLDYSIRASDGVEVAKFEDVAPMLVLGWKIQYAAQGGNKQIRYYFSIEWMDLSWAPLDNVEGEVTDYTAGIRWFFGQNTALSIAYRNYEAELLIRDDTLNVQFDGPTVTLLITW